VRRSLVVLVTGASGYIASHCVALLLNDGYRVRGTVRSLKNDKKVAPVKKLDQGNRLELVEADLLKEDCWESVVSGCDYVLHIASPFPIVSDATCIDIAVNGTLNVLRAVAKEPRVKKVVLTSSCAAVNGYTLNSSFSHFQVISLYAPTITFRFKLTCLNPTLVVGPLLIDEEGASVSLMRRFLNGEMPAVPELNLALVDVRDVAKAHLLAMQCPETDGERLLVGINHSKYYAKLSGFWVPRLQAPYIVLWLYSFFDKEAAACLNRVGHTIRFDNSKAKRLLGMEFNDPAVAMVEMGYSLIERGIVKKRPGYKGVPSKYKL
ncbi:Dihydroflavonol-4-reductase, partial [Trichostrongylus colubriformis]